MKYDHSVYTLVASAPVLRFIFVPAVVFIWTGELNRQRNVSYILKCMSGFHKCTKKYSNCFSLKFSKSLYFQFTAVQHTANNNIYMILH